MKDCLSLASMSEEFWFFAQSEDSLLSELSEGILIEILLWVRQKNLSVKFFDITKMIANLRLGNDEGIYTGKERFIKETDLKDVISKRAFEEISTFINRVSHCLRPVVFIDLRNEDFKYADWVRSRAYQLGRVSILSQYLIPDFVYKIHNVHAEYPMV